MRLIIRNVLPEAIVLIAAPKTGKSPNKLLVYIFNNIFHEIIFFLFLYFKSYIIKIQDLLKFYIRGVMYVKQ